MPSSGCQCKHCTRKLPAGWLGETSPDIKCSPVPCSCSPPIAGCASTSSAPTQSRVTVQGLLHAFICPCPSCSSKHFEVCGFKGVCLPLVRLLVTTPHHRSVCADQALCEASRKGRCPLRACLSSDGLASLIPESGNTAALSGCCGGGSLTGTD